MEPTEVILEGERSSLSGFYTAEEADFMAQLLSNCSSTSLASINHSSYYTSNITNNTLFLFSQAGSCISTNVIPTQNHHPRDHSYLGEDYDLCSRQQINKGSGLVNEKGVLPDHEAKRESLELQVSESIPRDNTRNLEIKSTKRPWSSIEVPRNQSNVKLKRSSKVESTSNDAEDRRTGLQGQSSSSCSSDQEEPYYANSQDLNRGDTSSFSPREPTALNVSGKTRATRGSATDPQSLYARKRRERINERLRILQNLVPNGTKVDISTMLEEAVQYVKFLQLQIKLLSSDDLWMYAPIAYNGMDIGLDLKITPPKQ